MQKTILRAGIILICSSRLRTSSSDSNKVELEFSPFKLEQISQFFNKNFDRSLLATPEKPATFFGCPILPMDSNLGFLDLSKTKNFIVWAFFGVPSEDMKDFFPVSTFEAIQMLLETISNQYKAFLIIYFNNFELF